MDVLHAIHAFRFLVEDLLFHPAGDQGNLEVRLVFRSLRQEERETDTQGTETFRPLL